MLIRFSILFFIFLVPTLKICPSNTLSPANILNLFIDFREKKTTPDTPLPDFYKDIHTQNCAELESIFNAVEDTIRKAYIQKINALARLLTTQKKMTARQYFFYMQTLVYLLDDGTRKTEFDYFPIKQKNEIMQTIEKSINDSIFYNIIPKNKLIFTYLNQHLDAGLFILPIVSKEGVFTYENLNHGWCNGVYPVAFTLSNTPCYDGEMYQSRLAMFEHDLYHIASTGKTHDAKPKGEYYRKNCEVKPQLYTYVKMLLNQNSQIHQSIKDYLLFLLIHETENAFWSNAKHAFPSRIYDFGFNISYENYKNALKSLGLEKIAQDARQISQKEWDTLTPTEQNTYKFLCPRKWDTLVERIHDLREVQISAGETDKNKLVHMWYCQTCNKPCTARNDDLDPECPEHKDAPVIYKAEIAQNIVKSWVGAFEEGLLLTKIEEEAQSIFDKLIPNPKRIRLELFGEN